MRRRQVLAIRAASEQALQAYQGRPAVTPTRSSSAQAQPERQAERLKPAAGASVSWSVARCAERLPEPHQSEFLALQKEADRLLAVGWSLRRSAWSIYRRETEWLK